jgi:hypothetical protein
MKTVSFHKILPSLLLLLFWGVSLAHLEKFPPLHNDEVAILAAGYKLFWQGTYGLDMYAGLYGRETIYLEVMPLMPWLQGLGSRLWGVGVWQMRLLPVLCGLFTLSLAFALARTLANRLAGVLAMLLLLAWQWSPGGAEFFSSGISLVDLVRIGRYDILLAPLSLMILLTWLAAHHPPQFVVGTSMPPGGGTAINRRLRTRRARLYLLCGVWIGLAGLANLYGLFWLAVVAVYWLVGQKSDFSKKSDFCKTDFFMLLLGCGSVMSVWLVMVLAHWAEFQGQFGNMHGVRFDLFSPLFYVNNIRAEIQRYSLGIGEPGTWTRLGFWLVIIGLPLSLGWLGWRAVRQKDRHAFWLLVPCLLLPILLALLVQKKQFAYLLLALPLWAVALAWGLAKLGQRRGLSGRAVILLVLGLLVWEGGMAWRQMMATAVHTPSPLPFFADLREQVPGDGRLVGPQTYWLAFPDREYRSFILPLLLSHPRSPDPISLEAAFDQVAPDVVLLTPLVHHWLALQGEEAHFWQIMAAHDAQLVAEFPAYDGGTVQIYELRRCKRITPQNGSGGITRQLADNPAEHRRIWQSGESRKL